MIFDQPRQLNHEDTESFDRVARVSRPVDWCRPAFHGSGAPCYPQLLAPRRLCAANLGRVPLAHARSHGIVSWLPGFRLPRIFDFGLEIGARPSSLRVFAPSRELD